MEMDDVNSDVNDTNVAVDQNSSIGSPSSDVYENNQIPVEIEELTPGGTKYWIPGVEFKTYVGKHYSSFDQLWDEYTTYANRGSFEAKIGSYYTLANGEIVKHLYCTREGFKPKRKYDEHSAERSERRERQSCRIGCPAMLKFLNISPNLIEVVAFVEKHNHSLVNKNDLQFLRAYRQFTFTKKQFIHQASHVNLGPVRSFKLMKQIYGGFEDVGATTVGCKNFRRDLNMFIGDRDAQMAVEKLLSRKQFIPGYFIDYFLDDQNALAGLFWADDVGLANYKAFGDVVSFDATFRSNKYKMVFVPFTGIDNHNRCVTFGAGLLAKENIMSYKWLLEAFKMAFVTVPNIFVTDQDPAMKQAIVYVFPNTRHRLCMWHIMQKLTSKVGPSLSKDESFKKHLCEIVWSDRIRIDYFEAKWAGITHDFNLHENKWLSVMFGIRFDWVPAFYVDEPLSGLMRTTSRSESENHFFGTLTHANLTLVEFLSHYDTAMDVQRYNHKKNDHHTRYTVPDMKINLKFEVDASKIYTSTIFSDVQEEINASVQSCYSMNVQEYEGNTKCFVRDSSEDSSENSSPSNTLFEVEFHKPDTSVVCSCKRYECYGLLCRHIFLVLRMYRVDDFPMSYANKRWSKDAVTAIILTGPMNSINNSNPFNEVDSVVREVYRSVEYSVNKLVSNMQGLNLYRDKLKDLMNLTNGNINNQAGPSKKDMRCSMLGVTEPSEVSIKVPRGIRNKGSGTYKRVKSNLEIAMEQNEKPLRQCKYCLEYVRDHDSRNCPKKRKYIVDRHNKGKGKQIVDG